jgi:glyoxylase-like metal-dependent hydrolase (beta-lactamase superfamily II)
MKRAWLLCALVAAGAVSLAAAGSLAQVSPGPKVVEIQKLKDNLYVLTGGGGNSAVFVTDLGVVLVDSKLAGWGQPILDTIKSVTSKPVTTIINTHAHGDHTGGNEFFPTSVEIVAQDRTRLNMDRQEAFKGLKVNYLPKLMFKDRMTLGSGKDRIDLYYFGAGHTGGDAWVVFPGLRVLHAGDMLGSRQPPAVDLDNGGSGLAYPDTLARAAASLKNIDTIIPGHGPLMTMRDLVEYAQFCKDLRNGVVSGFNHGLSPVEVVESWKVPTGKYAGYTAPADRTTATARTIFGELTRGIAP